MQSVSSWIWTRVAVSISYDDNHYTTGTNAIVKGITPSSAMGKIVDQTDFYSTG